MTVTQGEDGESVVQSVFHLVLGSLDFPQGPALDGQRALVGSFSRVMGLCIVYEFTFVLFQRQEKAFAASHTEAGQRTTDIMFYY